MIKIWIDYDVGFEFNKTWKLIGFAISFELILGKTIGFEINAIFKLGNTV